MMDDGTFAIYCYYIINEAFLYNICKVKSNNDNLLLICARILGIKRLQTALNETE